MHPRRSHPSVAPTSVQLRLGLPNTPDAPTSELLTPAEARARLGLRTRTNHTLRGFEKRGLLKPVRLGTRTLRYRPEDIAALIRESQ
jgi:hypothetical protein